ncbi:P-loop containing nucleoside triphosphate hydrolase protein [Obelidium mucronatum]|nr:P-loop containing nucleoside triphosphate hydrolase protein [Obelidium mucronatum]
MDNIKVVIRVRPLNDRETQTGQANVWLVSGANICLEKERGSQPFSFDNVYNNQATTADIYAGSSRDLIDSCCEGVNATIFAYGQTSSGKTYTMSGDRNAPGMISLAINHIFDRINKSDDLAYTVKVSYLEIYNENVNDLLSPANMNLTIREHSTLGVHVSGLTEVLAKSPESVVALISKGEANRHVGSTNMNERSSRSHTILRILIQSQRKDDKLAGIRASCLNLVDLAGSERAAHTGAKGKRLKEGGSINKSLLALATVIAKLSEEGADRQHIPYRDSKMTRILQPSLGGNARTLIICTVTPSSGFIDETISTLKFASRAKSIRNRPTVNEIIPDNVLIKQYEKQINLLKSQLNNVNILHVSICLTCWFIYLFQVQEFSSNQIRLPQ